MTAGARMQVRISPADVGSRVTVRSRIPAAEGQPRHTDTVGHLRAWEDGLLRIERRGGEMVTLAEADMVGAKVIPPAPARRRR